MIPRILDALYCASPFGPTGSWDGPAYTACGFWAHPLGYAVVALIVASIILTVVATICALKGPSFEIVFGGAAATVFGGFLWFIAIGLACAALLPSVIAGSVLIGKGFGEWRLARKMDAQREAAEKMRLVDEWLAAPSEHGRDGE